MKKGTSPFHTMSMIKLLFENIFKKYIILIYFLVKITLIGNHYHIFKDFPIQEYKNMASNKKG